MANRVTTQIFRSMDWVLCKSAGITFNTIQHFNKRNPNPSVTPQWSDKPLLKILGEDQAARWACRGRPIRSAPRASRKRAKRSSPARRTGAT